VNEDFKQDVGESRAWVFSFQSKRTTLFDGYNPQWDFELRRVGNDTSKSPIKFGAGLIDGN
jgi:hypothetical protein